jgi:C1A family cysteine protease
MDDAFIKPDEEIKSPGRLGWLKELPDARDWKYAANMRALPGAAAALDPPVRLTLSNLDKYMPVVDQGNIGSCTGCSTSYLFQWERRVVPRSILQVYYEARRKIDMVNEDSGAYIRDAVMVLRELGAGRASYWPYDEQKYLIDPPEKVDRDALRRKLFDAYSLQNIDESGNEYRHCLASKHPFVIGFTVYSGFLRQRVTDHGIYSYPDISREYIVGGHAIVCVGYDDDFRNSQWAKDAIAKGFPASLVPEKVFIFRNSWSRNWGRNGDVAMDARFISSLDFADDAWTARNMAPAKSGTI